jgi:hypothetical protein
MPANRLPLIARVEARAFSRAEERPVAVCVGGRRIGVTDILDRSLVTSTEAGAPVVTRFTVELEDNTIVELERVLPDGAWRCWRIER